ncbi:MAG: PilZ domain-containing protein [Oscillospiraceae bacterium]|nr:PilZ domain-containing protein [Oscillospiraceae bacterium]
MDISQLARGTTLTIFEELQQRALSDPYEAVLKYHETDKLIVVQCSWLYDNYDRINLGAKLNVSYGDELNTYSFIGRAHEKMRSNGLVMIEQLTEVTASSKRQFSRDELRLTVSVYGLAEGKVATPPYQKPDTRPELTDVSFDISSGGLCLVTNTLLSSKFDPYYLVEFTLSEKDYFLIPSRLVRRSNYPRTKIGRYDYGFQFLFDNIPDEKSRLTRAILNRKISHR